jgi:hypothetical protein
MRYNHAVRSHGTRQDHAVRARSRGTRHDHAVRGTITRKRARTHMRAHRRVHTRRAGVAARAHTQTHTSTLSHCRRKQARVCASLHARIRRAGIAAGTDVHARTRARSRIITRACTYARGHATLTSAQTHTRMAGEPTPLCADARKHTCTRTCTHTSKCARAHTRYNAGADTHGHITRTPRHHCPTQ